MRRLLTWQALDEAMPVFPVYALLFADHGLSAARISMLLIGWSIASFVLEIPSGAWADTISRRTLLSVAALTYGAGFAVWALWPSFAGFSAGFVLWALSGALSSGTFSAMAYDELAALGVPEAYARVAGLGTALSLIGATLASLAAVALTAAGGIILTVWASVAVCAVQLVVVRTLPRGLPQPAGEQASPWSTYVAALRAGVGEASTDLIVRTAVLASAGLMGLLALDEFFGLLLDGHGAPASTIPLWLTLVSAGQAIGGALAERATSWTAATFTVLVGLAGVSLAWGSLSGQPAGIVAITAGYGAMQLALVVADVRLQQRVTSGARATVTSVSNVLAEMLAVAVYALVGIGAPRWGYGPVLAAVSLLLVAGAVPAGRALSAAQAGQLPRNLS